MSALPTTTPQRTIPIKAFVVYLADGRIFQVLTDGGEGFFREQVIKGSERSIATYECFVVNGRKKLLTLFGGEKMTVEDPDPDDIPEDEDDEEDEED
jgi:hypothetical protein